MLQLTALSPHLGVQVSGVDLNNPIPEDHKKQLQQALKKHRMLLFRQGPISDDQHIMLMNAIGNVILESPGAKSPISFVSTDPKDYVGGTYRLLWHSDGQFTVPGALQAISLYAIEMERCEPTIYADMVRAASKLPPELRHRIADLNLVQCIDFSSNEERIRCRLSRKPAHVPASQFPCAIHPLLGKHPFTGEPMLNLSQFFTSHIDGMSDEESDAIFAELEKYQYEPSALYAHPWQVNDLLIWDNIALQHSRDAIAKPSGRKLRRVAINPLDNKQMMAGVKPAASRQIGINAGWS